MGFITAALFKFNLRTGSHFANFPEKDGSHSNFRCGSGRENEFNLCTLCCSLNFNCSGTGLSSTHDYTPIFSYYFYVNSPVNVSDAVFQFRYKGPALALCGILTLLISCYNLKLLTSAYYFNVQPSLKMTNPVFLFRYKEPALVLSGKLSFLTFHYKSKPKCSMITFLGADPVKDVIFPRRKHEHETGSYSDSGTGSEYF